MVNYTLLKTTNPPCGQPTNFELEIIPDSTHTFDHMDVTERTNGYATEVKVYLTNNPGGAAATEPLGVANVVCAPDSVTIKIITFVEGVETEEEEDDYRNAKHG